MFRLYLSAGIEFATVKIGLLRAQNNIKQPIFTKPTFSLKVGFFIEQIIV